MDTLTLANLVLDLASAINFVALLLMLRAVVKNRKVLRGYSIVGFFLNLCLDRWLRSSLLPFGQHYWFRVGLGYGRVLFIAFVYSLRQRFKEGKEQKEDMGP